MLIHKSLHSNEIFKPNRDEEGKRVINEKVYGKVHWLNGFEYKEEIEIREMYKQHRNNKLKNFSH